MISKETKWPPIDQNGHRYAKNGHSDDVLASKYDQLSPIWIKHALNLSHYQ